LFHSKFSTPRNQLRIPVKSIVNLLTDRKVTPTFPFNERLIAGRTVPRNATGAKGVREHSRKPLSCYRPDGHRKEKQPVPSFIKTQSNQSSSHAPSIFPRSFLPPRLLKKSKASRSCAPHLQLMIFCFSEAKRIPQQKHRKSNTLSGMNGRLSCKNVSH
jgi:hypothetical protein